MVWFWVLFGVCKVPEKATQLKKALLLLELGFRPAGKAALNLEVQKSNNGSPVVCSVCPKL